MKVQGRFHQGKGISPSSNAALDEVEDEFEALILQSFQLEETFLVRVLKRNILFRVDFAD
jgi:hypothetical protein